MQAILITAYKNFHHLEDIISYFDDEFNIYIHIDKKSTISREEIDNFRSLRNVKYISQDYRINWGGINHLKAILLLSNQALEDSKNKTFHLITGHDYPIVSLDKFKAFTTSNRETDFLEYFKLPYSAWPEEGMDRLSRYNMYDLIDGRSGFNERLIKGFSKIQKLIGFKRTFYKGFPSLYGGSTYWTLRRETLMYVFRYMKENPKYLKRFRYSFCSEEIFFQTILLNSHLKDSICNNNQRFIIWQERNGNFPANLDCNDFDDISKSEALFARKFEFPVSRELLDKIHEKIKGHH